MRERDLECINSIFRREMARLRAFHSSTFQLPLSGEKGFSSTVSDYSNLIRKTTSTMMNKR